MDVFKKFVIIKTYLIHYTTSTFLVLLSSSPPSSTTKPPCSITAATIPTRILNPSPLEWMRPTSPPKRCPPKWWYTRGSYEVMPPPDIDQSPDVVTASSPITLVVPVPVRIPTPPSTSLPTRQTILPPCQCHGRCVRRFSFEFASSNCEGLGDLQMSREP